MLRASLALILFGIAFGYVEAAVVVYLRNIYEPLRLATFPGRPPTDLFPLIPVGQLSPEHLRLLTVELGRELATILMLASVGLLAARSRGGQWVAGFAVAFGVWDITFYAFLKLFLDWPESLLTWDILFLLPVPWVGPVLAPVIISLFLIVCGLMVLHRDLAGRPLEATRWHWAGLLGGALITILSFTWDYRALIAGATPEHFNWLLFFAGLLVSTGAFAHAWSKRS